MDVQTRKIAWAAPQNVLAYHTTRIGGISEEQYKSSNLSLDVGDNPKSVKNFIVKNHLINLKQKTNFYQ